MKNAMSKVIATSLLSFVAFSFAHAAEEGTSKAEVKKQTQACSKKKQGDWVTYAHNGVTFNGSCQPNDSGKLQFSFPGPTEGASAAAEPAIVNTPAVQPAATAEPVNQNTAPQAIEQPTDIQPADAPIQAQ